MSSTSIRFIAALTGNIYLLIIKNNNKNIEGIHDTAPQRNNEQITILKITVVAALGGLLFGYDTGVIAGSQLYFTEYFNFSAAEQGWAVSSALYGCLVGALVGGYLTKRISRKYTLILAAALFTVSAWGSGIADSLDELAIYRILGGLAVGMASLAAPMYIAEIAPPKIVAAWCLTTSWRWLLVSLWYFWRLILSAVAIPEYGPRGA